MIVPLLDVVGTLVPLEATVVPAPCVPAQLARLDATEARDYGLVSQIVPEGTALEGAREIAAQILAASPTSVRVSLQLMSEAEAIPDPVDAATAPSSALDLLIASQDTYEGLMAFAEKRPPVWRNR